MPKLITDYGQFWERRKMFNVKGGRVYDDPRMWPDERRPPIAGRGIYILYRGTIPVYVGRGTARYGIYKRLQSHAKDWYAHAWDNVSWYVFRKAESDSVIDAVEALLVATIPGLLNSAQPSNQLGERRYLGNAKNDASNTLWKIAADDDTAA